MRTTEDVEFDRGEPGYQQMPTKELLASLFEQGKVLLKEEVRLAKEELRTEAKQVGASAGAVGGGAVLLHTGALVFAGCLVAALNLVLPLWAAALLVSALLIGVGALVARGGVNKLKKTNLKPEETLQTLKEDKEWLRRTMHAGTSQRRVTA
ncbi:MAG: phage holin family protein [Myxococcota bacterium]|nr:phage holin family protein [Myxococcota bacterium]